MYCSVKPQSEVTRQIFPRQLQKFILTNLGCLNLTTLVQMYSLKLDFCKIKHLMI